MHICANNERSAHHMCNINRQLMTHKEEKIALNSPFYEVISDQEGRLMICTNVQESTNGDGKQ
ncbi:hypothetical protein CIAM_40100 [Citrobacter amalonaticus]|nr:hypothetical protein CIAM_40100 [Citrobacter amalonaticus]